MRHRAGWQALIANTRRNHALEHATLSVMSRMAPRQTAAGYSDPHGFWIWADISGETLAGAVGEAVSRLGRGERSLAIHPNCGTNLAVNGVIGAFAVMSVIGGKTRKINPWKRFPEIALVIACTTVLTKPLGMLAQRHITTDAFLPNVRILRIEPRRFLGKRIYRIVTEYEGG